MSVRVIAGRWRGRRLATPEGFDTRPTSDRVREALFSMLGPLHADMRVLDLFAGTGALGIEALSRGAGHVTFVDTDRRAITAIRTNLEALGAGPQAARTDRRDAGAVLRDARTAADPYDLVFLDPPYEHALKLGADLQEDLAGVLANDARVVVESGRRHPMTLDRMTLVKERRYGTTLIRIYTPRP